MTYSASYVRIVAGSGWVEHSRGSITKSNDKGVYEATSGYMHTPYLCHVSWVRFHIVLMLFAIIQIKTVSVC